MDADGSHATGATMAQLDEHISSSSTEPAVTQGTSQTAGQHAHDSLISPPFTEIPDRETLRSMIDVYFRACHDQPYRYFHRETFERKLEQESIPSYLLLAIAATAVRFSHDALLQGHQREAMDSYARRAWEDIVNQSFLDDHNLTIHTVQAANMLGVIDFVGKLSSPEINITVHD